MTVPVDRLPDKIVAGGVVQVCDKIGEGFVKVDEPFWQRHAVRCRIGRGKGYGQ